MHIQVEFSIDFGAPVRLLEIIERKQSLCAPGIYILSEGILRGKSLNTTSGKIVYIGKAIRETIFSRCQKHLWSIQDDRFTNGNPRSRPGKSFKRYRESIQFDASKIWLTPGFMCEGLPYQISCAEEYLLHQFKETNSRYPWCNSDGQAKSS